MTKVFEDIFAIESDDAIKYKKESLAINLTLMDWN